MPPATRRYGPHNPSETYVPHGFPERLADLGEIRLNYAVAGDPGFPALLLIPGQTESWWGYEAAMGELAAAFQVYAVDLRGQGRSSRTPGRYTLDTMGNDLVRFIDLVVQRPVIVSGHSSGGLLAAWLCAYAKPRQVVAAILEDPPFFAAEVRPAIGPGIRQAVGPVFHLWSTFLGDQWQVGAWDAMREAAPSFLPPHLAALPIAPEPPQHLKEYDPEWGRAFWEGSVSASCDHARMLAACRVERVLLTHHRRFWNSDAGFLLGAMTDEQAKKARELLAGAGATVDYRSIPDVGHTLHAEQPRRYAQMLAAWWLEQAEANG